MRSLTADSLAGHNLAYREPAAYDELLGDNPTTDNVLALVDRTEATVETVLDLGCGTGRVLAELHARRGWHGTGIDLQPDLVSYARRHHPHLVLETGDLRTTRRNATYDLIVCLGNTLAYLHAKPELTAAFATITAHSHPGTLLAIDTLTSEGTNASGTTTIHTTALGPATVDTTSSWDARTRILTSHRTWQLPHGRIEHDQIRRSIWDPDTLTHHAARAGFTPLTTTEPDLTLCAVHQAGQYRHPPPDD